MVLSAMFLIAAVGSAPLDEAQADALSRAARHFRAVQTYRVTIRSQHASGEMEHLRYFYMRPGFVRIEFIRPYAGAVMIFNPNDRRVRLWPFGAGKFPEFNLAPDNPIVRSISGIGVDRSDVGALFDNIRALRSHGSTKMLGQEVLNGRNVVHFIVTGGEGETVLGVHSSEMWLDEATQFPVRVTSRDIHGSVIETVWMNELEINGTLPDSLFNP